MKLIFYFLNNKQLKILVKNRNRLITKELLTMSQGSDNMLIRLLDKILLRNKIRKSSLKNIEIQGEIGGISALGLVVRAVKEALLTLN